MTSYPLPYALINGAICPLYNWVENDTFDLNMFNHFHDAATRNFRIYCNDATKTWLDSKVANEETITIDFCIGVFPYEWLKSIMPSTVGLPVPSYRWIKTIQIKLSNFYYYPQLSSSPSAETEVALIRPDGTLLFNEFGFTWRVKFIFRDILGKSDTFQPYQKGDSWWTPP